MAVACLDGGHFAAVLFLCPLLAVGLVVVTLVAGGEESFELGDGGVSGEEEVIDETSEDTAQDWSSPVDLQHVTTHIKYFIEACEIVASDLRSGGGFRRVLRFSPPVTTDWSRIIRNMAENVTKIPDSQFHSTLQ